MEKENLNFQKLTPVQNVELGIYKNGLDFIFKNSDIQNIGITGAYCAGKSSVIETYKKIKPKLKFIHISLAYFENQKSSESSLQNNPEKNSENPIDENVIEGKILNQLIHQIKPKKIPQTCFKIKRRASKFKTFITALGILGFFIVLAYAFTFTSWQQYVDNLQIPKLKMVLQWSTNPICYFISYILMGMLILKFVFNLIMVQKNQNIFKKVSVQGNEIELNMEVNDSFFDKYLNEVLYLFENAGADVVVFEDMDRYNTNQIFQGLREVNTLINNQRDKPIRFFYLLRDDIFISKDRAKFFDFILPIVSILDGSNSYDQFIKHFKKGGIFQLFDENFLQGISLYVDDMRILKNIYNEFIIYNKRIGTTEQNANKLLAMIVYKNLFPRDFSDLQLGKGFVHNLFFKKDLFINNELSNLVEIKQSSKDKINKINEENTISDWEIDLIFSQQSTRNRYGGQAEFLKAKVNRKELLRQRSDGEIEKMQLQIKKIEFQIQALQNSKLSEIINRTNVENIFQSSSMNGIGSINDFKEIKSSDYFDLLKYLVRNGFIDETYPDYMTYFYEDSISRIDKVFLRSVTDERAKEFTYSLNNPGKIIPRLRVVDFSKKETLNFDLLCFLLQNQSNNTERLKGIILQLKESLNFPFIAQFLASEREAPKFIKYLNHHWPDLFVKILSRSDFSEVLKNHYALETLYVSPEEDLKIINNENVLSSFVSKCPNFLQIEKPDTEQLLKSFKTVNVQFNFINYLNSNIDLWDEVYSHDLYELNWNMIETILEHQYKIPINEEYSHKNLTLILSKKDESLTSYVERNMNIYFKIMLGNCNNQVSDEEEVVEIVLNDASLGETYKQKYIEYLDTQLTGLRNVKDKKWWTILIKKNLICYSEENILCYFFEEGRGYDDVLCRFVNDFPDSFDFSFANLSKAYDKDNWISFFMATVECNTLQNEKYELILQSLDHRFDGFEIKGIDIDKMEILIRLKIIPMNQDVLLFMRKNYPKNIIAYIEKYENEYIKKTINKQNFLLDEALDVCHSNLSIENKKRLLNYTNEPISVREANFETEVEAYILEHNFHLDDLTYLIQDFEDLNSSSQLTVIAIAKTNIDEIISNEYPISYSLLIKILSDISLPKSKRLDIFSFSVSGLDYLQCKQCLEALNAIYFLSIFDGKRPKFRISIVNERILKVFEEKDWIASYGYIKNQTFFRASWIPATHNENGGLKPSFL